MARIFPDPIRRDVPSHAERMLYECFRDSLSDDYHVFHSVGWQARTSSHGARDGEADFVIAHPVLGIVVLEVKGGQIDYDGHRGLWFQNGREMDKDPFEQAKSSKYHLMRTMEEESFWRGRLPYFAHGVCFPDVVSPSAGLTLQAPKELILDRRDLSDLETWIRALVVYAKGDQQWPTISPQAMKKLIDLLAPVRHLRSMLGVDIQNEEAEFVRLTEEQYRVLDFLSHQPRASIAGCAGSGKTMLAAEKARRLADRGWDVLLTCYNRNLADFLREEYLADHSPSLTIGNFHKVALDIVKRSGLQSGSHSTYDAGFFDHTLPDLLIESVDRIGPQFDAIIVDEGQDFLEHWWVSLDLLLREKASATFYVFYDNNQNLYGGVPSSLALPPSFPLQDNCRNTQMIHRLTNRFYRGSDKIRSLGPVGRDILRYSYRDERQMLSILQRLFHELIQVEGVDPFDMVVLTPKSVERSHLSRAGRLGNFRLTTDWLTAPDEVFYTTIHSFKGLESPVVILTELDFEELQNRDALLYVGGSRARHHLIILHHESVDDLFLDL